MVLVVHHTQAILIAAIITFLAIVAEHYFPWRQILHRDLPPIPAYVLGILAIALPFSVLILMQRDMPATTVLIAFWTLTVVAGATTLLAHMVDDQLAAREQADERQQREAALLAEITR